MFALLVATCCSFLLFGRVSPVEVKHWSQLEEAKKNRHIVIRDLIVPAATTLDLTNLLPDTTVTFAGSTTFEFAWFAGPLIKISGKNLKIVGEPGNLIDGRGERYWTMWNPSNSSMKRPRTMELIVEDSVMYGLNFKNPPEATLAINWCKNTLVSEIHIDAKDGDGVAKNTDGIGVGFGSNVTVRNVYVHNQDDCFVTGAGCDITIDNITCVGGHGLSIGSLGNGAVVENVVIKNSKVIRNFSGVQIKTGVNLKGAVRNVIFENIELEDIEHYGIFIHGNYPASGPWTEPTPFPIENIRIRNVRGTVQKQGANAIIWVAEGAKSWKFENISITGGGRASQCKGLPDGFSFPYCSKS